MERISYDEARGWFWTRTVVWLILTVAISVTSYILFARGLGKAVPPRIPIAAVAGVGAVGLGLLAAWISIQFVWMRRNWRFGFAINGPFCAVVAALAAFLVCGIILSFLQSETLDPTTQKARFQAYTAMIDAALKMMEFGIGASAFWGFIFGSWFALRLDKYFVEPI